MFVLFKLPLETDRVSMSPLWSKEAPFNMRTTERSPSEPHITPSTCAGGWFRLVNCSGRGWCRRTSGSTSRFLPFQLSHRQEWILVQIQVSRAGRNSILKQKLIQIHILQVERLAIIGNSFVPDGWHEGSRDCHSASSCCLIFFKLYFLLLFIWKIQVSQCESWNMGETQGLRVQQNPHERKFSKVMVLPHHMIWKTRCWKAAFM